MTRKEAAEMVLGRVPEDVKETFIEEMRKAKSKEECINVLEKYAVSLSEEEMAAFTASNEVSEEDLDEVAGGCMCFCDPFPQYW